MKKTILYLSLFFLTSVFVLPVASEDFTQYSALIQSIEKKMGDEFSYDENACAPLKKKGLTFYYYRCRAVHLSDVEGCQRFFSEHQAEKESLTPPVQACDAPGLGLIEYVN